jgi:hypothetical protein
MPESVATGSTGHEACRRHPSERDAAADLSATAITDAGLKELRLSKNLRLFAFKRTPVTDVSLGELKAFPRVAYDRCRLLKS